MCEIRRTARVIGPGKPGYVRVEVLGTHDLSIDVPLERIPPELRAPNCRFVAVMRAREILRVEEEGHAWITIQDRIREVLNSDWDPIGVAAHATPDDPTFDEYDSYIAGIYGLLRRQATEDEIAGHLQRIEVDQIGLACPDAPRRSAARRLLALRLPSLR